MATISNGESGSSVRTKLNEIINKVEGVTSIDNNIDIVGTLTSDGLTVDGSVNISSATPSVTIKRTNTANEIGFTFLNANDVESFKYFINGNNNDLTFQSREANVLKLEQGGDISFYENTGTTAKFFWDAAAESLGIGTSSPDTAINIGFSGADQANSLRIEGSNGSSERYALDIEADGENAKTNFKIGVGGGTPTTRMTIDSSGNVGIGTDSPSNSVSGLHISTASSTDQLYLERTGSATAKWYLGAAANSLYFHDTVSASTRMIIDSSGNLLVGKTSVGISTDGFEARAGGITGVSDTSGAALYVNRNGSDGDMVIFQKTGSPVGSIGTEGGDALYIQSGTTSGSGLHFKSNVGVIRPARNGSTIDNAIDLGSDTRRFKDLYLSGGVYLGGTTSDNLLDDYEEGTWTPVLEGTTTAGSATYTNQIGRYTKIGRCVHFRLNLVYSGHTGTGNMAITGLPFTNVDLVASGSVYYTTLTVTQPNVQFLMSTSSSDLQLAYCSNNAGFSAVAMDSAAEFRIDGFYFTT